MRHAGPAALDRLEPLLSQLRQIADLKEKARGTFYRRSRAFLHFHEDPTGLYADVRLSRFPMSDDAFDRLKVDEPVEQAALITRIRAALDP